jgi:HlyD family secretion protein
MKHTPLSSNPITLATTMTLHKNPLALALAALGLVALAAFTFNVRAADEKKPAAAPKAALTVNVTQAQMASLTTKISANGNIAPWQEASVGTEANGLRLAEVRVNVGDVVKKGEVLATFAPDTVQADLAQSKAAVAEAEATLAEASANAQRARELQTTGALSAQQIAQYATAERTAQARLEAQRAMAKVQQLRLRQTQVLAPDSGVISARGATVGAVLPAGQELFRLIRKGRLEWRAEVSSAELAALKPGVAVTVAPAGGAPIKGTVRMLAPTVDPQTRNALVYVDLPAPGAARAGMFARGEFAIGSGQALTLPQSAVLLRDGFSYVLKVGADSKVTQAKVTVGRRSADRIEITSGLDAAARVVASGGGFLVDGDTVRVVESNTASAAAPVVAK